MSQNQVHTWEKVAVIYGGLSQERSVSLQTGEAIYQALVNLGYNVSLIDAAEDIVAQLKVCQADVVYNALHGTYGEDGCLQGILEWYKIPYTGSGVMSSALAMDKEMSRQVMVQAGVPVAKAKLWSYGNLVPDAKDLPPAPWAFKPVAEGSSVGVHYCATLEDLHQCMHALKDKTDSTIHTTWLIESWLDGTEVSVVVCDGETWGGVEISPAEGWYNFEAKYQKHDTQYHCPPRISSLQWESVSDYAQKTYQALACRGVCRIDFIVSEQNIIALELNTLPGMTATSLVPKVAQQRGMSFEDLVSHILHTAGKDHG
jgi:D-alanine-D-alanine ligase